jgi:hypothetical protein
MAEGLEELDVGVDEGRLRARHGAIVSMTVYIDKYQYIGHPTGIPPKEVPTMDTNISAWMIAGGPRIELQATIREREQLHAFRESQRAEQVGLIDRIRGIGRAKPATELDLVCCPA